MMEKSVPTLALLRQHRDAILRLADRYGAENVRVFGSVARGDATPESDIDLLVNWDYQRLQPWGSVGLIAELQTLLPYRVDIVSEKWIHPSLRAPILVDAVPL
jgi:uncharacterized protein